MNQQETEALATRLAGTKCQKCGGTGDAASGGWNCLCCRGTGYLFPDSVRVPCSCSACYALGHAVCGCCAGHDWTPSHDFVTWRNAMVRAGYTIEEKTTPDGYSVVVHDGLTKVHSRAIWHDAKALLTALARKEPQ